MMRVALVALVLASCGPLHPAVTVPAPVGVATADPKTDPAEADALVPPEPKLRLPKNFVPTGYTLRLAIDPALDGFEGAIQIAGNVAERSTVIWLHGKALTITTAKALHDGAEVALAVTQKGEDLLEVRAKTPLDAGAWTLSLDYHGKLDTLSTAGVFKQTVADKSYVYTQLEAIYARRAFPCVDEPDNKVPWKLTLDVPKADVAVANTPQVNETPLGDKMKRVEFAVTKPLPSYLIAFGVGPFDIVDAGKTKHGVPVRIVTLAKRGSEAAWAAKTSVKILEALEEWFGMPYPYEKLDMLTIPLTVGFGAMENAGLITYTETLMLFEPGKRSKAREHTWVVVAAHEMAHQWFGDLVTMEFWEDIWLNEGFANWMEVKITDKFDAAYHEESQVLGMRNGALGADALVSARQIRQPIQTVDDIFTAFDGITYNKGASVLAMFESYLGPDVFQQGVRAYLAERSYANATSAHFAAAIGKASGKPVDVAFASFLDQPGAPEITATLECKAGKSKLSLSQRRYVPPGAPAAQAARPWIVPVCVAYDNGGARGEACTLLSETTGSLALDTKTCPRWVMPNKHGAGYYRNTLTAAQATALRDTAWGKLTWTERLAVYFDVEDASTTGKLPLQLAMSFVPKLMAGNNRFTVGNALGLPLGIDFFVTDAQRPKYERWLRTNFGPGAIKAGLIPKDGESLDLESMRGQLVTAAGWYGREPKLVAEAVKLSEKWRDLPQATRELVLSISVDARPEIFARVLQELPLEQDRSRREVMYGALAGCRDPVRQKQALGLLLDLKVDIRESRWMLFQGATEANRAVARAFYKEHFDEIMKRLPTDETAEPQAFMSKIFTGACDPAQRDGIAAYVTKTFGKLNGGERIVKQAIEEMDQCIARRKINEPQAKAWLDGLEAN